MAAQVMFGVPALFSFVAAPEKGKAKAGRACSLPVFGFFLFFPCATASCDELVLASPLPLRPCPALSSLLSSRLVSSGGREIYIYIYIYTYKKKRYSGASAARVWGSIYWENLRGYQDSPCMEKRILFRLLSGLHSSIMTQIANDYRFDGEPRGEERRGERRVTCLRAERA